LSVAIIGAGAIGALAAGYLKLKGEDVYLVAKPDSVDAIHKNGVVISGVRGEFKVPVHVYEFLVSEPKILIVATKTQDVEKAIRDNLPLLKKTIILTTQNGVQSENIIARLLPKENILSSIVMFGSTLIEPGRVVHNFEGDWVVGSVFKEVPNPGILDVSMILDKAFPAVVSQNILGMKYLKIFVNANNCIPAILGLSMQEAFADHNISIISIKIWEEGFNLLSRLNIKMESLPGFPIENVTKLIAIPKEEAAKIFSGIMTKLSKDPLYGSILQSIRRGKASEIDYINGEFVSLAEKNGLAAPLNRALVELVHRVEKDNKFLTKEELTSSLKHLLN